MADPVVHITAGIPDSGTGNITTLGQTLVDGANVTFGAKTDAKNAATDATSISAMQVLKQISASVQAPPAITGAVTVSSGSITAVQGTGTNLHTVVDSGSITAVQGTGTNLHTVVDSGSITAVQGTGTNLHTVVDSGTITTVSTVTSLTQLNGHAIDLGSGSAGTGTQRVIVDSAQVANLGQAAMSASMPVVIASDQSSVKGINGAATYVVAGAGATTTLGTGAIGDYLSHVIAFPGTTSPGVITILDLAVQVGSFPGGASSVSNLVPFVISVGAVSVSGAWKITCGTNITAAAVGRFTP